MTPPKILVTERIVEHKTNDTPGCHSHTCFFPVCDIPEFRSCGDSAVEISRLSRVVPVKRGFRRRAEYNGAKEIFSPATKIPALPNARANERTARTVKRALHGARLVRFTLRRRQSQRAVLLSHPECGRVPPRRASHRDASSRPSRQVAFTCPRTCARRAVGRRTAPRGTRVHVHTRVRARTYVHSRVREAGRLAGCTLRARWGPPSLLPLTEPSRLVT